MAWSNSASVSRSRARASSLFQGLGFRALGFGDGLFEALAEIRQGALPRAQVFQKPRAIPQVEREFFVLGLAAQLIALEGECGQLRVQIVEPAAGAGQGTVQGFREQGVELGHAFSGQVQIVIKSAQPQVPARFEGFQRLSRNGAADAADNGVLGHDGNRELGAGAPPPITFTRARWAQGSFMIATPS